MAQFEHNVLLQAEELEALSSLCDDSWKIIDHGNREYAIEIFESIHSVHLEITLPVTYPSESLPSYILCAPWMDRDMKNHLYSEMENIYIKFAGECIIYMWIEKIKEVISKHKNMSKDSKQIEASLLPLPLACDISQNELEKLPIIQHGETIVDRHSVFQAHLASVVNVTQVNQVVTKLKENSKIATAAHNIVAYRLFRSTHGTFLEDSDDDGENRGGSTLLHLLHILDVQDVVVIVSRWYGGIHLGSDRFKHINNAARTLLDKCGYIKDKKLNYGQKSKKKK